MFYEKKYLLKAQYGINTNDLSLASAKDELQAMPDNTRVDKRFYIDVNGTPVLIENDYKPSKYITPYNPDLLDMLDIAADALEKPVAATSLGLYGAGLATASLPTGANQIAGGIIAAAGYLTSVTCGVIDGYQALRCLQKRDREGAIKNGIELILSIAGLTGQKYAKYLNLNHMSKGPSIIPKSTRKGITKFLTFDKPGNIFIKGPIATKRLQHAPELIGNMADVSSLTDCGSDEEEKAEY